MRSPPRAMLSLSLSLLLDSNPLHQPARALLGPPCPPPPSQPQFVSAGAFLQAPGPGSQLPPALLHRTTTPPFEFFFRVSRSSPLQHLSSIGTASADPAGLRLPPSLGGGKQALPYFGGLPFFCASNSAPKSVSLGWILKYAGCCDSCCCARGWLTSSSSSSVCVCVYFAQPFFPDVLLNPRTLVPHVESCCSTTLVAVVRSGDWPPCSCRAGLRIDKSTATWLCYLRSHVLTLDGTYIS